MLDLLTNAGANLATLRYNYNEIAAEHRESVQEAAIDIRQRTKRASEDILAIGRKLGEIKELLPHGQFTDWVSEEFDLSIRTAQRMMAVAERFDGKSDTVTHLSTSVLYLLASPSTPDAAIDAVVEYTQSNGTPTKAIVQEIVADHKPARTLTDQEAEVVVWRAIKHSGVNGPSAQVDWVLETDMATYTPMLAPGVVLDYQTFHRALQTVRSQLEQMASRLPAPLAAEQARANRERLNRTAEPAEMAASPAQPTERPNTSPPPPTPQAAPIVAAVDEDSADEDAGTDDDGFYKPETDDARNSKIDNLLGIYRLVLATLPKFEAITGCYSHAGQLRRAIDAVAEDLERNRIL